jgi:hypothetical protein
MRSFSLLFFQVLDIAVMMLFLISLDCQYFSVPKDERGINQEFPDVRKCKHSAVLYCWLRLTPHLSLLSACLHQPYLVLESTGSWEHTPCTRCFSAEVQRARCATRCSAPAECWAFPHLIHAGVSAAAIIIYVGLAYLFNMAEIELNPLAKSVMGVARTK